MEVIPNEGSGAAAMRIEAVRCIFPKRWFNDATTEAARCAWLLSREQRNVGVGPEHDWSSHAADPFGLMAIAYEEPSRMARFNRKIDYPQLGIV